MTPYTLEDAERDLGAALADGDPERITVAIAAVDRLDQPRPAVSLHSAALYYAEQGLHIFPLQPGTKIPFKGSSGCKDATTKTDRVAAWWTGTPEANIGIATGYLIDVIDVDGVAGAASWARYADELPPILGRVSTPRPGGNHLYVAAVPERGNRAGILPHVDYRGVGGYVVAPPSIITDGPNPGTYSWHRPIDVAAISMVGAA